MQRNSPVLRPRRKPVETNGLGLKIFGWIFTLAGILSTALYGSGEIDTFKMVLLLLSYVAMPVFSFLVVQGVIHTSDFKKYLLSMLAAAVIAEPFFDYASAGTLFDMSNQNALFSLAVCQIMAYFMKNQRADTQKGYFLSRALFLVAGIVWAVLLQGQYGVYFVLMSGIFYLFRERKYLRLGSALVFSIGLYYTPEIALIPIEKYNGERGEYPKYLFYALYPAMWVLACVVKLLTA